MNRKYNKADILDTGVGLIRRNGYHHTGINEILKASGIPKGSFYNFFSSKEDFVEQALDYYGSYTLEFIESFLLDTQYGPLQRMKNFYRGLIQGNQEENFLYGCMVGNMSSEVGGLSEVIARSTKVQLDRWFIAITRCIQEGQDLGEINDDLSAEELAKFCHTSFLGGLARMKTTRSAEPLEIQYKVIVSLLTKQRNHS